MKQKWVVSCEHGGNQIPRQYAPLFHEAGHVLRTHRGYDPGALELFQLLAGKLEADYTHFSLTSRLLIELNRSLHHPNLFSTYTKSLSLAAKKEIIDTYYLPYRSQVEDKIRDFGAKEYFVTHISVHSFTNELNGEVRKADIGLLYDPAIPEEKWFCEQWKQVLKSLAPEIVVRLNYPYKGKADGFTTYLRKRFPEGYKGIELEVNQKHSGDTVMNGLILESLHRLKNK